MKLTKATIGGLTLPADKQDAIFFDEEMRGFGIRVRAGGKRTWVVQYQLDGHQQRRLTIGRVDLFTPDEARKIAREHLAKARLGQDPQREKEIARSEARITLGAVAARYLKAKQEELRPNTYREVARYLHSHWWSLHGMPLHRITRRDVAVQLSVLVQDSGPAAAMRARVALSSLFAWAIGEGLVDDNPVSGTNRPTLRSRERVLSDAELIEVWKACPDDDYGRIIRLLILTGARRQEVSGMRWSELDPERGTWTIPAERTKNGRVHVLPLPPMAWEMIGAVPHRAGIDHLFGRSRGGERGYVTFHRGKATLDGLLTLPHWTVHDLRRSAATGMAEIGIQPHIVEAVLNHASGHKSGIAGIYNKATYENEMRAALAMWADHVRSIVEGGGRRVVALHQSAMAGK
jgi:integrase